MLLPLPDAGKVGTPHDEGVEYYLPASGFVPGDRPRVGDLDVTQINAGRRQPAQERLGQAVAFKGGSEIGVLSFDDAGQRAMSGARLLHQRDLELTGEAIDEGKAEAARMRRLMGKLARGG